MPVTDPNLPTLKNYLAKNYGNYVNKGQLTSGFKKYNEYDFSIDYQLIYKTIFGPFNAFITLNMETGELTLKSLSVVSFPILEIDVTDC